MVEPSDHLQAVFEKALDTAKKLHHEYLTIEHILCAMLMEESFANSLQGFGANPEALKIELLEYLQNKCDEITVQDVVVKPKKHKQLNVYLIVHLHKCCLMDVNVLSRLMCFLL
jgi:ATP-dependent Clp protease ATP-binding subunit ClpA